MDKKTAFNNALLVINRKCNRTHGFKPERDYPRKQRDHKLTEKMLKREENFINKLIMDMFASIAIVSSHDLKKAYMYRDCVIACKKGKLVDCEKAYWDLGIYEFTKMYGK